MEYYIQNTESGYLGNSIMFWAVTGGYTPKLEKAEKFTWQEAKEICECENTPGKYKAWSVEYIDNNEGTARVTDSQYLDESGIVNFKKIQKSDLIPLSTRKPPVNKTVLFVWWHDCIERSQKTLGQLDEKSNFKLDFTPAARNPDFWCELF